MNPPNLMKHPTIIRIWLAAVALATLVMILVGGVTRLTDSGLSMTDWKPILGSVPPRTPVEWDARFAQYQASPQFEQINSDMDLDGFKTIFFWEWLHRVLGRGVGLLALLPFLLFAGLRWIRGRWLPLLFAVPFLVLMQGLMGWFMVKSGLVDIPRVSPFRLAAHLGLALVLFCYCLWQFCRVVDVKRPARKSGLTWLAWGVVGLVSLQGFLGAMVAGLDAGDVVITWPKMFGHWIPPRGMGAAVFWHFMHRTFAWVVALAVVGLAVRGIRLNSPVRQKWAQYVILVILVLQILLGIFTILQGVPIALASAHQVNAALLLGLSVIAACEYSR